MGYTLDTFLIFNNNLVFDLLIVPTSSELTRCSVDDLGVAEKMQSRLDGTRSGNPLVLGRRSGEGRVCSPQKGLWTQGE